MNEVKGEMPSITNLATNAVLNAKINLIKGEIPNITNLATTSALTAVENKMPKASNLVKKKLTITEKLVKLKRKLMIIIIYKYINTSKLNKFTAEIFLFKIKMSKFSKQKCIANFLKRQMLIKLKDVTSNRNEFNELSKNVKAISTKGLTEDLINKFIMEQNIFL